jgi:hypothetical protein
MAIDDKTRKFDKDLSNLYDSVAKNLNPAQRAAFAKDVNKARAGKPDTAVVEELKKKHSNVGKEK